MCYKKLTMICRKHWMLLGHKGYLKVCSSIDFKIKTSVYSNTDYISDFILLKSWIHIHMYMLRNTINISPITSHDTVENK